MHQRSLELLTLSVPESSTSDDRDTRTPYGENKDVNAKISFLDQRTEGLTIAAFLTGCYVIESIVSKTRKH
jgi:hypothetical protein